MPQQPCVDMTLLDAILERYPREEPSLIQVLQDVQRTYNYLPCDVLATPGNCRWCSTGRGSWRSAGDRVAGRLATALRQDEEPVVVESVVVDRPVRPVRPVDQRGGSLVGHLDPIDVGECRGEQRSGGRGVRLRGIEDRLQARRRPEAELAGRGLDPRQVERAVKLSKEKYCSATIMLARTAEIETSITIVDGDRIPLPGALTDGQASG